MSEIRDSPRYYITPRSPTLWVGIVKLSKYQITFLIEFTKSLRAAFNNAGGAGALEILSTSRIPGYKSRVFIPVGRRVGRRQRGRLLRGWRRGTGLGRGRGRGRGGGAGNKDVHVETATTTEFLHAAKSGLLTERRNWMHLLLHAGTYARIRTYVSTYTYALTYAVWLSREHARRTERNTSRPHFQFVSVYLKNGERNPRSTRSPLFQAYRRICAWKKEDPLPNVAVTFSPFHVSISEFSREIESTGLVTRDVRFENTILLIQWYYLTGTKALCDVACIFFYTLILK